MSHWSATIFEPTAQFLMIVYLTVADRHDAAFRIHHGLVAVIFATDGEARSAQHGGVRRGDAGVIRPAMRERQQHCVHPEPGGFRLPQSRDTDNATNSTHL